jgi:LysM repeat protein
MEILKWKNFSPLNRIALCILLVLALFAASLPYQSVQAADSSCAKYYTVKSSDTLQEIAQKFGLSWKDIAKVNGIKRPSEIKPGDSLCIPSTASSGAIIDNSKYDVTVYVSGGRITITTASFKNASTFIVKVRPGEVGSGSWTKLGKIKVEKSRQTVYFALPAGLRTLPKVTVCLKDVRNDNLICRTVVSK